jgi:hypothetical protein
MKPSGETTSATSCKRVFPNFSTTIRDGGVPVSLPIGRTAIVTELYNDSNCLSSSLIASGSIDYFVSDNISRLLVNLPVTAK